MKRKILLGLILGLSAATIFAQNKKDKNLGELKTVPSVDLKRYAGKWFEIAKYPNRFQKQCASNTTAEYVQDDSGKIKVINRCVKNDGTTDSATGKARIVDKQTNAKLEVRFAPAFLSFLPFVWGDYWIIDLGEQYEYSVVGSPDRKYLWILSRTPEISDTIYQDILQKIKEKGFQPEKLVKTPQK